MGPLLLETPCAGPSTQRQATARATTPTQSVWKDLFGDEDQVSSRNGSDDDKEPAKKLAASPPPTIQSKITTAVGLAEIAPGWTDFIKDSAAVTDTATVIRSFRPTYIKTSYELPRELLHNLYTQTHAVRDHTYNEPKPIPADLQRSAQATKEFLEDLQDLCRFSINALVYQVRALMEVGAPSMLVSLNALSWSHKVNVSCL